MPDTKPILLVHGAWHGAWCWSRLIPELAARGRHAVAIDLPGAGADPADPAGVTLARYADRIVEAARGIGRPVVLVGHSMGGVSITQATELAPDLIATLVYLAAFVPGHGQTLLSLAEASGATRDGLRPVPNEAGLIPVFGEAEARHAFYHDCPDALVSEATAKLTPIPAGLMLTPVRLPTAAPRSKPRHYIECLADQAIPIASQRWMAAAQGHLTTHTLDSSHSPFLSMPGPLADLLAAID